MSLSIIAGAVGLIGLAVTIIRINKGGGVSRKAGEYWIIAFVILIMAGTMIDVVVFDGVPVDRINTGSQFAFNYYFPEKTLGDNLKGILIGIAIDVVVGIFLLHKFGDTPKVDAAIVSIPMAYHLARTYNIFQIETINQSFALGTAFWATLIVSWIMIIPSFLILKWADNRFEISY